MSKRSSTSHVKKGMRKATALAGLGGLVGASLATAGPAYAARNASRIRDPAVPASAVPILRTAGTDGLVAPIAMTRGTHEVSETIPLASQSQTTLAIPAHLSRPDSSALETDSSAPEIQVRVGPDSCAGFNGDWSIYIFSYAQDPSGDILPLWALGVWGIEWDDCSGYVGPSSEYTYVNFYAAYSHFNHYISSPVHGNGSEGVNGIWPTGLFAPDDVYVTACLESSDDGWQCGASAGPFN
jgi:hypothetical protein